MDILGARDILSRSGLFDFEEAASRVLERYFKVFSSDDEHENQFRSNMASIGAAEFAVLRSVLNGESAVKFQRPVLELDVSLAILTADTLRTRPCRTAAATRRGRFSTSDLFMLSGDASKAWYILNEQDNNVAGLDSRLSFLELGANLFDIGRGELSWLPEIALGFDKITTLFAFMRMNVIRNRPQPQVQEDVLALSSDLGILGTELA
ncbi:MAG: hypothetical protein ABSB50_08800 [Terracidiphilus sp.]